MLSVSEIKNIRFDRSPRGYKCEKVDNFLIEIATQLDTVTKENQEKEQKILKLVDRINEYREDEDAIKNALLSAQKQGMKIIVKAEQEAKQIIDNATIQTQKLVIATKEEYNEEIDKLTRLKHDVSDFKANLTGLYNKQLRLIMELPEDDEEDIMPKTFDCQDIENDVEVQIEDGNDEVANTEPQTRETIEENEDTVSETVFNFSDIQQAEGVDYSNGYYNSQDSRFGELKFGDNQNK